MQCPVCKLCASIWVESGLESGSWVAIAHTLEGWWVQIQGVASADIFPPPAPFQKPRKPKAVGATWNEAFFSLCAQDRRPQRPPHTHTHNHPKSQALPTVGQVPPLLPQSLPAALHKPCRLPWMTLLHLCYNWWPSLCSNHELEGAGWNR